MCVQKSVKIQTLQFKSEKERNEDMIEVSCLHVLSLKKDEKTMSSAILPTDCRLLSF